MIISRASALPPDFDRTGPSQPAKVLGGLFLAVILVVGAMVFAFNEHIKAPDVAAIAASAPARAADAAAMRADPTLLAQIAASEPWLVLGATAVVDGCSGSPPRDVGSGWGPTQCDRRTTEYFGFNGDLPQQTTAWDTWLTTNGWDAGQGMTMSLGYFDQFEGRPRPQDPGSTYLATDLPEADYHRTVAQGSEALALNISWAERGATTFDPTDTEQGQDAATVSAQKVDVAAVETSLFKTYQYVAIVTLSDGYYSQ